MVEEFRYTEAELERFRIKALDYLDFPETVDSFGFDIVDSTVGIVKGVEGLAESETLEVLKQAS